MSNWSIVSGKALGLVATSGGAVLVLRAFVSFSICLPIALLSGRLICFGWWMAISGSTVIGYAATATVMLALGSLFPNLTAFRLNCCIRVVVLYFVYLGASYLWALLGLVSQYFHFTDIVMWAISVSIGVGVILLSLLITIGAISGMRKGDIDIKLAKR